MRVLSSYCYSRVQNGNYVHAMRSSSVCNIMQIRDLLLLGIYGKVLAALHIIKVESKSFEWNISFIEFVQSIEIMLTSYKSPL
jgi:hypothetical protein